MMQLQNGSLYNGNELGSSSSVYQGFPSSSHGIDSFSMDQDLNLSTDLDLSFLLDQDLSFLL